MVRKRAERGIPGVHCGWGGRRKRNCSIDSRVYVSCLYKTVLFTNIYVHTYLLLDKKEKGGQGPALEAPVATFRCDWRLRSGVSLWMVFLPHEDPVQDGRVTPYPQPAAGVCTPPGGGPCSQTGSVPGLGLRASCGTSPCLSVLIWAWGLEIALAPWGALRVRRARPCQAGPQGAPRSVPTRRCPSCCHLSV